jgi:hypothetical protein
VAAPVDHEVVARIVQQFDVRGRLIRWPGKQSHQLICLWVLWASFPSKQIFSEMQINSELNARHLFSDAALLRRDLVGYGLFTRTPDCREYRRLERQPPGKALELIRHLNARQAA